MDRDAGSGVIGLAVVMAVGLSPRPSAAAAVEGREDLPRLIAHRAAGTPFPANTLAAVRAHGQTEVGALELDVRRSLDGVVVVFHDQRLEPATNCSGTVEKRAWAELEKCRYLQDGKPGEHGLARLDDVLKEVRGRKMLFLDAKEFTVRDSGLGGAIVELLRQENAFDSVIVESFNPMLLRRARRRDKRVRLMFDFAQRKPAAGESPRALDGMPGIFKQKWFHWLGRKIARPDYLGPRFSVSEKTLRRLSKKYALVAWTVNDEATARRLLSCGVTALQTDDPDGLGRALR